MSTSDIETISLPHLPPSIPIYAALYQNVTNAAFLREQLLQGNQEFEYAFIEASMVLSRRHALAAVFRAVNDYLNDRLKSRNVHSEIVFSLGSNNNIGEAFRRFGISDTTTDLLVFKVATMPEFTGEKVQSHLDENVKGTRVVFEDGYLAERVDLQRVRKVHKLGSGPAGKKREINGTPVEVVDERKDVEIQVLGLMALKGAS